MLVVLDVGTSVLQAPGCSILGSMLGSAWTGLPYHLELVLARPGAVGRKANADSWPEAPLFI